MRTSNENLKRVYVRLNEYLLHEVERVSYVLAYDTIEDFLQYIIDDWLNIHRGEVNNILLDQIANDNLLHLGKCTWKKIEKYIYYNDVKSQYQVQVYTNKKSTYIGCFKTMEEAIEARDKYIKENKTKKDDKK